ncbi:pheA operon leader peptide PheL [Pseudocitrobacter faecalis]|nr:pheA operon leader peptide PheL [Pseudocitrobacter faecalis]
MKAVLFFFAFFFTFP